MSVMVKHWDMFCDEVVDGIGDPLRSSLDFFSLILNDIFRNINFVYLSLRLS